MRARFVHGYDIVNIPADHQGSIGERRRDGLVVLALEQTLSVLSNVKAVAPNVFGVIIEAAKRMGGSRHGCAVVRRLLRYVVRVVGGKRVLAVQVRSIMLAVAPR